MVPLLIVAVLVAFFAFAIVRLRRLPKNNPKQFQRKLKKAGTTVVACVGASTVQGQISFNFVDYLSEELKSQNYYFVNAGVNGDLAYNVLQRMPEVLRCNPKFLVIQVAGNDVMASLDPKASKRYVRMKHLPKIPSIQWYEENVRKIIESAKQSGVEGIAIISALLLGENIDSRANMAVKNHNKVLSSIAIDTGVDFLNVFDKQIDYLIKNQKEPGPEYTGQMMPMIKSLFFHGLFGFSLDTISKRNGFLLTTDYIHQNSTSGKIVAGEIERFLQRHKEKCV